MNITLHFNDFLKRLLPTTDSLILAISGGVDSVVLLHLLVSAGQKPILAHVNYGLRGNESNEDADFVNALAKTYNLVLETLVIDTEQAFGNAQNLQDTARKLRYNWFDELKQKHGCQGVLAAHHLDDKLEGFLMSWLRGGTVQGLIGMKERRQDGLLRPLLPFAKADLLDYAARNGLAWREDASNAKDLYTRNFLRLHVLPKLKQLQPHWASTTQKTFKNLEKDADLLAFFIQKWQTDNIEILTPQLWRIGCPLAFQDQLPTLLKHSIAHLGFSETQINNILSAQVGARVETPLAELWKQSPQQIILAQKAFLETHFLKENQQELSFKNWDGHVYKLEKIPHLDAWNLYQNNVSIAQIPTTPQHPNLYFRRWQPADVYKNTKLSNSLLKLGRVGFFKHYTHVLSDDNNKIHHII